MRTVTQKPVVNSEEWSAKTFQTDEAFFWAAFGYLLLTGTATLVFRALERRYAIHR